MTPPSLEMMVDRLRTQLNLPGGDARSVAAELHALLTSACPEAIVPPADAVLVSRWNADPLQCGAYSFLPQGSLPDGWSALQAPLCDGRVWLGGEAIHEAYSGYLQGALLSGRDRAQRIVESLR